MRQQCEKIAETLFALSECPPESADDYLKRIQDILSRDDAAPIRTPALSMYASMCNTKLRREAEDMGSARRMLTGMQDVLRRVGDPQQLPDVQRMFDLLEDYVRTTAELEGRVTALARRLEATFNDLPPNRVPAALLDALYDTAEFVETCTHALPCVMKPVLKSLEDVLHPQRTFTHRPIDSLPCFVRDTRGRE